MKCSRLLVRKLLAVRLLTSSDFRGNVDLNGNKIRRRYWVLQSTWTSAALCHPQSCIHTSSGCCLESVSVTAAIIH